MQGDRAITRPYPLNREESSNEGKKLQPFVAIGINLRLLAAICYRLLQIAANGCEIWGAVANPARVAGPRP